MLSPNFQGTELQEYKEEKYTLIQAVSDKLLKKAAALLDRGNVKAIDPDSGDSVFHIAIRQADKDDGAMLELLLSHANMIRFLHTRNKNNLSPAELAIVREYLVVLQKIITLSNGQSPLIIFLGFCFLVLIQFPLQKLLEGATKAFMRVNKSSVTNRVSFPIRYNGF